MIGGPVLNYRAWRGRHAKQQPRHWRSAPKKGKLKPAARGRGK